MSNDQISESLGMNPIEIIDDSKTEVMEKVFEDIDGDLPSIADLADARLNYKALIDVGTDALETMLEIAKSSQEPRAFEVIAILIKAINDSNKSMSDLPDQVQKLKANDPSAHQSNNKGVTNNNLFVGSTEDLQRMLAGMKNNDG